jgi:hypothetical protein
MSGSTSLLMKDTVAHRSNLRGKAAATPPWGRWAWGAAAFDLTAAYAVQAELADREPAEGK